MFLRPLDEVRDDQEVARIFHARDDAQLEVKPLAVFINGVAKRNAGGCEAALKPRLGALAQFARLVECLSVIADGKARKDGLMRARTERTASRYLHSRRDSFREIGKTFDHFRTRLKAMLRRQLAPLCLCKQPAFGDADQCVMRLVILRGRKIRLVGGDQRH